MLRPGLMGVLYRNKCLRVAVLLCLSLICGHLLGLLHQQGDDRSSAAPVFNRAVRTAWEVKKAQTKVDQTVQTPSRPFPTAPPHFRSNPDFPYRYLINEPHLCEGEVFVLNMIPVPAAGFAARQVIRALWGNRTAAAASSSGMRTVFVLGASSAGQQEQRQIEEESLSHHDIIQVDFVDSYRNLTLKTLTMLHWTLTHCPHATWLLKSDSDVFVNPFALKSFLAHQEGTSFVCQIVKTPRVCRQGRHCPRKWAVSLDEYQNNRFPTYCNGPAYVVSASMVEKLYAVANKTQPFFLEDVYFTGILPQAFQPRYVDVRARFKTATPKFEEMYWNGTILFSMFNLRVIYLSSYALWDKIVEHNNLTSLLASP